ncbi:hypothetical protein PSYPI_34640 [Pseudomonas syringae pv. pisi str. 1704B]|uniref:Uncharacterized protein n=1 Tax=Pseudomonas syringae pv. pisi str. 1704B TaxID=629263 RepID=F3GJ78_PSESJ|nr:hypothetical protein PSYPI_34640 [Pseudomonas syringae pv. pisi str. 1704B]
MSDEPMNELQDSAAPASAQQMNISSDRSMDGFRHQLITQLKRPIN